MQTPAGPFVRGSAPFRASLDASRRLKCGGRGYGRARSEPRMQICACGNTCRDFTLNEKQRVAVGPRVLWGGGGDLAGAAVTCTINGQGNRALSTNGGGVVKNTGPIRTSRFSVPRNPG